MLWPTVVTVPVQVLTNLIIKLEHKFKDIKVENIHCYNSDLYSSYS